MKRTSLWITRGVAIFLVCVLLSRKDTEAPFLLPVLAIFIATFALWIEHLRKVVHSRNTVAQKIETKDAPTLAAA